MIDGDLLISRIRPEDAGTYVCSATNEYGQTDIPVELNVGCKSKNFVTCTFFITIDLNVFWSMNEHSEKKYIA